MADNTTLSAGSGGDVIATDDIGGVKYQRVKVNAGADGSATDITAGGGTEATALRVTIASDSTGTLTVNGGVAHDGADSGNPVKVGAKARTADITAVSAADRTDLASDTLGHVLVRPYALHENLIYGGTQGTALTSTTSTQMIAAAGAGIRNYITSITVTNSSATGTNVQILDGNGGTVMYEGYAVGSGGGFTIGLPTPLRGSANTRVDAKCGTGSANVYVSLSGYKSAV